MRPSPVLLPVLLGALVLGASLASAAQSAASPSSPQQPATAPAQSPSPQSTPGRAQRGEDSATAPSRPQAEGQSSNAQSEEENPLHLTDEQKTKLRPILIDESQQMEAVRNDTSLTQEQKVAKANAIRETASPKIKAVLTPEQLQKLADLQQKNRQNPPAQEQPPKK